MSTIDSQPYIPRRGTSAEPSTMPRVSVSRGPLSDTGLTSPISPGSPHSRTSRPPPQHYTHPHQQQQQPQQAGHRVSTSSGRDNYNRDPAFSRSNPQMQWPSVPAVAESEFGDYPPRPCETPLPPYSERGYMSVVNTPPGPRAPMQAYSNRSRERDEAYYRELELAPGGRFGGSSVGRDYGQDGQESWTPGTRMREEDIMQQAAAFNPTASKNKKRGDKDEEKGGCGTCCYEMTECCPFCAVCCFCFFPGA